MTARSHTLAISLVACLLLLSLPSHAADPADDPWTSANAESFVFPASMKVTDLKKDFGAVGDGITDDTAALQKAFNRRNAFLYIPNGTYLVRDRIQFSSPATIGPTIQGQSRDGVIIRLADDAKGFDDPANPREVIRLINDGRVSADYFKTKIRNLTIDAGRHRGAIGLNFYANNNGTCEAIRIIGNGVAGLDLSHVLNGPLLVSNVHIEGFDVGVKAGTGPFNSQTIEHLVLSGQRSFGIHNDGEALFIRDLHSDNKCPAVFTRGGTLVLVDAQLRGGADDQPAIICAGNAFIRNVDTDGYQHSLRQHAWDNKAKRLGDSVGDPLSAGRIEEWHSQPGLTPNGSERVRSLNLAIEVAPHVAISGDHAKWVFVDDFGAKGDGVTDDSEALRKAFEHAAGIEGSTVCFRADASYRVSGDLPIRGGIERLQGANSYLLNDNKVGPCRLILEDGTRPVVTIDLLDRPLGGYNIVVENASKRTLVVKNLRGRLHATGPGRTFLQDSCARVVVTHREHRVWARQVNSEARESADNLITGGSVWVLGFKTEGPQRLFRVTDGGKLEVLGGWLYQYTMKKPEGPMFEVVDSTASFAGMLQFNSRGVLYDTWLESTQDGKTNRVTAEDNGNRPAISLLRTE